MIKKLYSADRLTDDEDDGKKKDGEFTKTNNEKLGDALTERKVFSYNYSRLWCLTNFGNPCFCCCRARSKRRDFLYRDAKAKLGEETDLLEIVKKIRIFKFASDIVLKPRQRDLISFFDEYKLKKANTTGDAR